MSRRPIKLLIAGVVTTLAVPAGLLVSTVTPAGAITTACQSTQAPVASGAQANLHVGCATSSADLPGRTNPVVNDSINAGWHNGEVQEYKACSWSPASTTVSCALGAPGFSSALINHSVSSNLGDGKSIAPRSFIVSGSGLSFTLSALPTGTKAGVGILWVENSTARSVADLVTTNGSTTVTSATANFISSDTGGTLSSTNLQTGTTMTFVNATTATVSNAATATGTAQTATINGDDVVSSARVLTDVAVVGASNTITSFTANFAASDIGQAVKAPGVPAGAYITGVGGFGTTATLSAAATVSSKDLPSGLPAANAYTIIGKPSVSAPKDGDKVSNLGALIALSPGFVAGAANCADGASGFTLAGAWYNPGKYKKISFLVPTNVIPDIGGSIGQIVYSTSVTTFAAYVVPQLGGGTKIMFPFVPTGIAACPGTDVSAVYNFDASSISQGAVATGVGRPNTTYVRAIKGIAGVGAGTETLIESYNSDLVTNDVQTITMGGATAGGYILTFNGCSTPTPVATGYLKFSSKSTDVVKALAALPCIGAGNVKVTGSGPTPPGNISPFTVTFVKALGGAAQPTITVSAGTLNGSAPTVVHTTTGSTVVNNYPAGSCLVSRPALHTFPCGIG